jgi:hypothetical protein
MQSGQVEKWEEDYVPRERRAHLFGWLLHTFVGKVRRRRAEHAGDPYYAKLLNEHKE